MRTVVVVGSFLSSSSSSSSLPSSFSRFWGWLSFLSFRFVSTTSDSPLFFLPLELSLRAPYVTQAPIFEREKRDRN